MPDITRELFETWRAARRGSANPERMTNPVWCWLAAQPSMNAYQASRHFGLERPFAGGAGWVNDRFGQSTTALPDGRTLAIAGEHEDYYDPDFYIYNDVIVTAPDGDIEIYGYSPDVFPPTDFHSATLVGDHVYMIGNLGYRETRGDRTQVLRLDVRTLAVETLATSGESPGWLSRHHATLDAGARRITVTGGRVDILVGAQRTLRDAVDDHVLDLHDLTWTRTTDRRWTQHEIERADGRLGYLWQISQLADYADRTDDFSRQQAARYRADLGREPDLIAWRTRFQPPLAHQPLPSAPDEWRIHRILVDNVTVRYVDDSRGALLVVEGDLPSATIATLVDDVRAKLARADNAPYTATCLDQPPVS